MNNFWNTQSNFTLISLITFEVFSQTLPNVQGSRRNTIQWCLQNYIVNGWELTFELTSKCIYILKYSSKFTTNLTNNFKSTRSNFTEFTHLAVSGLTVRLPVWPWQQVCVKRVRKWGVRATWIFIMTSPVYWRQRGGHTQVRLFGPPESTVNWPGRRREEGGSELIAHIRVIQVLPVADNWIDEDEFTGQSLKYHPMVPAKLHGKRLRIDVWIDV